MTSQAAAATDATRTAPLAPEHRLDSGQLRASPNFALSYSMDGRPYLAQEVEPYAQFWLSERDRVLLSLFSARGGATVSHAIDAYFCLTPPVNIRREKARLLRAIGELTEAGILIGVRDDTSRYDADMARDYLTHRPFPPELTEWIAQAGRVGPSTRILDLAGGPGSLALSLAARSQHVTLMELSRGFVTAARAAAKRMKLPLHTLHESCNRLMHHDGAYDVVAVSQALHWLDDVQVCRGLVRVLSEGGSFFVVIGEMRMTDDHPLSYLLGEASILGLKRSAPFGDEALAVMRRLTLLFEALEAPDVRSSHQQWLEAANGVKAARIVPVSLALFRQARPVGLGFAKAYMSPRHVSATGQAPDQFWAEVEARVAAVPPERRVASMNWAVLQFRRDGRRWPLPAVEDIPVADIGWSGPAES